MSFAVCTELITSFLHVLVTLLLITNISQLDVSACSQPFSVRLRRLLL